MTRLVAALFALVLVSCGSVRVLREAQDQFNRAAEIENQARLPDPAAGLRVSAGAESEYRAALAKLKQELRDNAAALKADGLWHTARFLKVLCLWRIAALGGESADFKDARGEAAALVDAKAAGDFSPGLRDRVLLAALPGLLDHEKGLRSSAAADFKSADAVIESALATEKPPADHEVRFYLRLAQLASLREWMRTVAGGTPEEKKKARDRFTAVKDLLKADVDANPAYALLKKAAVSIAQAAGVTW